MCCREGLDKPPKSATKLLATRQNILQQPAKQGTATSRGKAPPILPVILRGQSHNRKGANIETVDLAGGGQYEEFSSAGPQSYKSLNRLHNSVQKAAAVELTAQKRPTFSYAKGTRPSLSFLGEPHDTVRSLENISSEHDNSWMDDFPSPSALIGRKAGAASTQPPRSPRDNAGAKYDDSVSELEACMVGLDDSVALGNGKVDEAENIRLYASKDDVKYDELDHDLATKWSSSPVRKKHATHPHPNHTRVGEQHRARSKGQSILMSTDSPEKPGTPSFGVDSHGKRTVETCMGSESLAENVPPTKKRRISLDHRSQSLQPVASLSLDKDPGQGKPAEIVERPGWEGIDPDLIAEYGDIVEFVEFI